MNRTTTTATQTAPRRTSLAGRAAVAAGVLCLAAGAAWGQNALGDGTGLVRDLGRNVPPGRANTAANFRADLALRNAIVTGNAPGGTSFRGDVGYVAPGEFRGQLGSNDLFAFRRDSLFSGFAGLGLRGTEALQYQFALTTGSPRGLLGVGSVSRSGAGMQGVSTAVEPTLVQQATELRNPNPPSTRTADQTDQGGSMMGMLRSPAAYMVNRGIQPEIMSAFGDARTGTSWALTASSLRGVRMSRLLEAESELARPNAMATSAAPSTAAPTGQPESATPVVGATRVTGLATPNSYQGMMERYRALAEGRAPAETQAPSPTPAPTTPTTPGTNNAIPGVNTPGLVTPSTNPGQGNAQNPDWESRLQEIRDRLSRDLNPGASGTPDTTLNPQTSLNQGTSLNSTTTPGSTQPNTGDLTAEEQAALVANAGAGRGEFRPLDPEVLRIIRESSVQIDRYAVVGAGSDAYEQHMAVAGQLLKNGAYFDAEERFTRAQAARRDDYLASVGRVHAQLGAGMYLSAGMNLRRLLSEHPEVAAAKFDAAMLPAPARLEAVATELRTNASRALAGESVLLGTDSALLLAYIGFQRGNDAVLAEGLDTYRRLLAASGADEPVEGQTSRTHGSALLDLITNVWGNQPQEAP